MDELKKYSPEDILKNPDLKKKFIALYEKVFNEKITNKCKGCLKRKLNKLLTMNTKTIKLMAGRTFLLKPNTCIWVDRLNLHITNENLTDEIAIKLLKTNRGYLKFFQEIPEGWDRTIVSPVPVVIAAPAAVPVTPAVPAAQPAKKDYEILKPATVPESVPESVPVPEPVEHKVNPVKKKGRPKKNIK